MYINSTQYTNVTFVLATIRNDKETSWSRISDKDED